MDMQESRAPLFEDTAPANSRQSNIRPPQHEQLGQTDLRKLLVTAAQPPTHSGAIMTD